MHYPKGVPHPGDQIRFGVKLYQAVRWSKIIGDDEGNKLELRSPKKSIVGMVKLSSKKDSESTVDEWLVKGNCWIESPSTTTSGTDKETKRSSSKPRRPKGAQTTATGDIIATLYA